MKPRRRRSREPAWTRLDDEALLDLRLCDLRLSLARSGRRAEAIAALKRASELSDDPRFAYAYAVALHSSGKVRDAIAALERARARHPRDRDVLFALATFHRDAA